MRYFWMVLTAIEWTARILFYVLRIVLFICIGIPLGMIFGFYGGARIVTLFFGDRR